mgnify:CR=1 FL=1
MNKKITVNQDGPQMRKSTGYSKIRKTVCYMAMLVVVFLAGCKKDDFEGEVVGVCPVVTTDPMDKAVDVVLDKLISATFNTNMNAATINNSTFTIKQGTSQVSGKVEATANGAVFTFKPDAPLLPFTKYTGTITAGVKDTLRTAMVADYVWTFTTIPQVSVTADPVAGGTAIGGGAFAQSSVVTVNSTPAAGYTFLNWTETDNGPVISTSASYQFAMAGNRALIANFQAIPIGNFAVNLSSNPVAGGTTTGGGSFAAGSSVTVTARPNSGYTFVDWTENGTRVSTSSSIQFTLNATRTFVANFRAIPASQFAVVLSSSPVAGGTTDGEGAFASGTSVTVTAAPNTGYNFTNWTDQASGTVLSTSPNYTFALSANKTLVANFALNTYTLTVNAVNGTVAKNPDQARYNYGSTVTLTATPAPGYIFSSWSGDATGSTNPLTVTMNANKNITANFTALAGVGPAAVNLGTAGNFVILTKSGISTTGVTSITGDIGVSPAAATALTGFGLIMDTNGQSSHTPIVSGKAYAADYAAPTPAKMTTAVSDMETAFTTANGLTTPAPIVGLYAGDISGRILPPGLYKWSTGVLVTNAGVTLTGGPNDTWVFQIAQNLTINNNAKITLLGGAQAKNIFWVVTGQATLGSNSDVSGIILSKTLISLNTGAKVNGRLLAQTAVTLNASTVIQP